MQKKTLKNQSSKKERLSPEARARRTQQLFFMALAAIMIVAMVLALVAH